MTANLPNKTWQNLYFRGNTDYYTLYMNITNKKTSKEISDLVLFWKNQTLLINILQIIKKQLGFLVRNSIMTESPVS